MRFKQFLLEMAKPNDNIMSKIYYHGCNMDKAKHIKDNGIEPPKKAQKGMFAPIKGMVYLTPYIKYALKYSTGELDSLMGNIGETSYLFEVDGKELKDVFPDEDSIATFFRDYYLRKDDKYITITKEVEKVCEKYLDKLEHHEKETLKTANYRQNFKKLPAIGKKILKLLSDEDVLILIEAGAHLSHKGILQPTKIYAINNDAYFKRNSKFEDFAKEIKRDNIGKEFDEL